MTLRIINKHFPLQFKKKKYPPWFSREVISTIKCKYRISEVLASSFKVVRSKVKLLINKCHENFVDDIQSNIHKNIKLFWSYTKSKKQTNTYPNEFSLNNGTTSNIDVICQSFSDFFQSTYTNASTQISNNAIYSTNHVSGINTGENLKLSSIPIHTDEVNEKLKAVDTNKGCGPDGIPNIFLYKAHIGLAEPLSIIFNKSIQTGIFPSKLKSAYITPIFKNGKKSVINNYRPVCLLNSFATIFERIVHEKMINFVCPLLSTRQHGFMKKRSTLTNLSFFFFCIQ